MKMVHGYVVFIREEAKLVRNTTCIHFQHEASLLSTQLTSSSIKRTTPLAAEIICSHDYDMALGGVAHKSWYLCGVESFAFSQLLAQN